MSKGKVLLKMCPTTAKKYRSDDALDAGGGIKTTLGTACMKYTTNFKLLILMLLCNIISMIGKKMFGKRIKSNKSWKKYSVEVKHVFSLAGQPLRFFIGVTL